MDIKIVSVQSLTLSQIGVCSELISIKMEFFTIFRKHLAMCGIEVPKKSPKTHPFNVKNVCVFTLLCVSSTLIVLSIDETVSFDERAYFLFHSFSQSICGIIYEIIVWKSSKLFEFIDKLGDLVKESE